MSALFTSVPVDNALGVTIRDRSLTNSELSTRTTLSRQEVKRLLGVCLNCIYIVFGGNFYRQIRRSAMFSPVSSIVCNHTRFVALLCGRYVDDTSTKRKVEFVEEFTNTLTP